MVRKDFLVEVSSLIVVTVLGERLREARIQKGLTLEQAAEHIGVRLNTVWRYEKGEIQPSEPVLKLCCQIYEKPLQWFFGQEEEPKPPEPDPESTYEDDIAFIESVPQLAFRGLEGDLTPEEARTIRELIELMLAKKRENG